MMGSVRSGDDDLGVYQVLVEFGVLALLVGGGDELMSLILEPFADAEFVLGRAEKLWDLIVVLSARRSYC